MFTRELMHKDVESCTMDQTALEAGEIMNRRNCGFIPIVRSKKDQTIEGVLTDRDMALYLAQMNRPPSEVPLSEFCTHDLRVIFPDADLHQAKKMMESAHIHRLPVTDKEGKLLGVLSLKDLAKEAWKERELGLPEVSEKEIAEVVEAISIAN